MALFLEERDSGGLQLEVHSSSDFPRNLAEAVPAFSTPAQALSFQGLRVSGGNVFLYILDSSGTHVASLDCSTAPTPAVAALSVEAVPYAGGAATPVADGGSVFIGDQLRIKPAFSPTDAVQPLLYWRLDYDFHDGNALDSNPTTYRLKQPDSAFTAGAAFPSQLTLIGPCDPAQVPQGGSAPVPSSGAGCWESVTTNADWTVPAGTPDFPPATPGDKQLTIGFEVQNALNEGSSSLAKHRITWKVPRQFLRSTAILSGGALEDLSEGSPLTSGLNWYVSQVPVGQAGDDILTLQACTGTTCTPSPALVQPGNYRYWVTVPYRGGFRTAECPGLQGDQVTCSGDAAKIVSVTDVVLSLTAPAQVLVGTSTTTVSSTSKKAALATACPVSTTGFSYNFCVLSGGSCPEGAYVSTGVTAPNPFPASGTGSITVPTPAVGTWGLRVRYTYTTAGDCAAPAVAQWPASGWSPLTVLQAVPSIRLRNSSDTADIPKSIGIYWELLVNQTARLYAELNGVRDTNPPAGLAWSYRPAGTLSESAVPGGQGASFSISTVGEYEIVLKGYGLDVIANAHVSAPGGTPPTVSSVTFSTTAPAVGDLVTVSCTATAGTNPVGSYFVSFGDGQDYTGAAPATTHAWTTEGTKSVSCTAYDVYGLASAPRSANVDVWGTRRRAYSHSDHRHSRIPPSRGLRNAHLSRYATAGKARRRLRVRLRGLVHARQRLFERGLTLLSSGRDISRDLPSVRRLGAVRVSAEGRRCLREFLSGAGEQDRIGKRPRLLHAFRPELWIGLLKGVLHRHDRHAPRPAIRRLALRRLERLRLHRHRAVHAPDVRRAPDLGDLPPRGGDRLLHAHTVPRGRYPVRHRRAARRRRGPARSP